MLFVVFACAAGLAGGVLLVEIFPEVEDWAREKMRDWTRPRAGVPA